METDDLEFEQWLEGQRERLVRYAQYRGLERTLAEDAVGDVIRKAIERKPRVRPLAEPSRIAWLCKVTRNQVEEYRRDMKTWERHAPAVETHCAGRRAINDPEDDAIQRETSAFVREALNSLSSRQSEVLLLRFYDGLSLTEIAEQLKIPYETAGTQLFRAKLALIAALARHGFAS